MSTQDVRRAHAQLRRAVAGGSVDAVRTALDAGADAGGATEMRPVLSLAAEHGVAEIVELLVARGADVARVFKGWSAATEADANEHFALANRLVELGAPPDSRLAHGYSELHRAARRGEVDAPLAREALEALDAAGQTPLMLAITNRRERAADVLLSAGANPNFTDRGHSLLCEAAYQDACPEEPTHFVARLLRAGANPNLDGTHPLLFAVNQEWSSAAVLRELVEAGANINAGAVLHRIAEISSAELIDVALELGASLEARDHEGHTPLLAAAHSGNVETFARLLERGADVRARDARQRSVIELLDASSPESAAVRALVNASRAP